MVCRLLFLILIFLQASFINGNHFNEPIKRTVLKKMTTSVVIPCCGKHFYLLPHLLQCYSKQTTLPDEVVISLSDVVGVVKEQCSVLEQKAWPFNLKIIKSERKQSAGENRNIACAHVSGDIVIFQDADDLPHPQRIEIVKYWFENYKLDHLMHLWSDSEEVFKSKYDKKSLEVIRLAEYFTGFNVPYLHNGNICVRRKVAQAVKWEHVFGYDLDVQYNQRVYNLYENKVIIKVPLVVYRNHLSSFK